MSLYTSRRLESGLVRRCGSHTVGRVNDPTRDWMGHQLQLLTWKVVASIQAQAAMPKEVNDLCSLGIIWRRLLL